MSFGLPSRQALEDAVRVLDQRGVSHSEIMHLGEAFGIYILVYRADPEARYSAVPSADASAIRLFLEVSPGHVMA